MKRLSYILATVALLLGVSTTATAQDADEYYPHNFISVQGGGQVTLTHYDLMDLFTPQVAVSFGRYFNPKVGARLHLQGFDTKGGFQKDRFPGLTDDQDYKFKAVTGDLGLLMNMSNIIFGIIRAIGIILAGWGLVQVGMSFQSHDPSQRSQGFLCLAGGLIIVFAKSILTAIAPGVFT